PCVYDLDYCRGKAGPEAETAKSFCGRARGGSRRARSHGELMGNKSKYLVTLGILGVFVILSVPQSQAQPQAARSDFEVASIKPNTSGDPGRYIRPSAGRLSVTNMAVKDLLTYAFQVRDFQISGGPGWINSDRYDIEAKTNGNVSPEQSRAMLKGLLEDRFKLKVHRETKELPIYVLIVAKNGLKIQPTKEGSC